MSYRWTVSSRVIGATSVLALTALAGIPSARAQDAAPWPADEVIRDTLRGWGFEFTLEDGDWVSRSGDGSITIRLEGPGTVPQRFVVESHRSKDESPVAIIGEAIGVPDDVMGQLLQDIGPWMVSPDESEPGNDCLHAVHAYPGGLVAADKAWDYNKTVVVSFLPPGSQPTTGVPECSQEDERLLAMFPAGAVPAAPELLSRWSDIQSEVRVNLQDVHDTLEALGTRWEQGLSSRADIEGLRLGALRFPGIDHAFLPAAYGDFAASAGATTDVLTIGGNPVVHSVAPDVSTWRWATHDAMWTVALPADTGDTAPIEALMSAIRPLPTTGP